MVGSIVHKRPIDLMANGSDNRNVTVGNGSNYLLIGEGEEILYGSSAPAYNDDVAEAVGSPVDEPPRQKRDYQPYGPEDHEAQHLTPDEAPRRAHNNLNRQGGIIKA